MTDAPALSTPSSAKSPIAPIFGSTPSALAVVAAVLSLPYNLQVVSYNTTPQLLLMVATAAGVPAVLRSSVGWAAVCSAAAATAAVSYVVILPSAGLILLAAAAAHVALLPSPGRKVDPRFAVALLAPGTLVGLAFLAWVSAVPGWMGVLQAFQAQSGRSGGGPIQDFYLHFVSGAKVLPLVVVVSVAALFAPLRDRWRSALLTGAAAGLGLWGGEHGRPGIEPTDGRYAGALALAIVVTLGVPLFTWLMVKGRCRAHMTLGVLALPAAAVGVWTTSSITKSGPALGAYAVPLGGVVILVVLTLVLAAGEADKNRAVSLAPAVGVNAALVASLVAIVFSEGPLPHLDRRITEGPGLGLLVGNKAYQDYEALSGLMGSCPEGSRGFLSAWVPAAYLWWPDVGGGPQYWMGPDETTAAYSYIQDQGYEYECVLAPAGPDLRDLPPAFQDLLVSDYVVVEEARLTISGDDVPTSFAMYVLSDGR
ncbi:hypothetical protein ACQE98_08230 [Ornithinimicrobium sp. W1679]|uniref:hypothetical protein n=1 Tax=Ornithinimicrobium sp. W1679 TaxID=3418770 RepID=UPI003CEAC5F2